MKSERYERRVRINRANWAKFSKWKCVEVRCASSSTEFKAQRNADTEKADLWPHEYYKFFVVVSSIVGNETNGIIVFCCASFIRCCCAWAFERISAVLFLGSCFIYETIFFSSLVASFIRVSVQANESRTAVSLRQIHDSNARWKYRSAVNERERAFASQAQSRRISAKHTQNVHS